MSALLAIAGPVIGAVIALIGVYVNQLMQRSTQKQIRHQTEIRDLAADLLALSERLWRDGWALHQAARPYLEAVGSHGQESFSAQTLFPDYMDAMRKENRTHEKILSAQRRLMLTSPALDRAATRLVEGSRLWPPPLERPSKEVSDERDMAERAFVEVARKQLTI